MDKSKVIVALWIACVILAIGMIAFAVSYFIKANESAENETRLENLYEQSFYDLVDNVDNIEVNLSKLSATSNDSSREEIVDDLISQTNTAQDKIASLPIDYDAISNTISFINKTNGYCTSLSNQLAKGNTISEEQETTIESLYDSALNIKQEINRYITLLQTNYRIVDNVSLNNNVLGHFPENFQTLEEPSIDYPELIYDGPFSDSVLNKEIKGLPEEEIGELEAKEIVTKYLEPDSIESDGLTQGKFETYNFTLTYGDNTNTFVQITKRGGFILSIIRSLGTATNAITAEEGIAIAEEFALSLEIPNMKSVWWAENDQSVYVNLAPVINDVTYYPDLIKVKVSLISGEIVGWEAMNYAYNHIERELASPSITSSDAVSYISPNLDVLSQSLCVIPGDYVGEIYAYEFKAVKNANLFYIYVNADTGDQERILRVVDTDDGAMLM